MTRGLFWRHFGVFNVRKVGIYGVDLICHVEREMPSTLTYLVPRPFEAESASKTGTRATGTPPHPPMLLLPWIATYRNRATEQAASSLLQMLQQISLKRWGAGGG